METNFVTAVLFVGFTVESAIFLFRKATENWQANRWALLSALLGTILAFVFDVNIPRIVGLQIAPQSGFLGVAVSYLASGMVAGRGANGLHDLLKYIKVNVDSAEHKEQIYEMELDARVMQSQDEDTEGSDVSD